MPMINFTQPITLSIALILFVLMLILAKETKKSIITGIMLFAFIAILIGHAIEFTIGNLPAEQLSIVLQSMIFDLIFVLISFISYLWVDDIESKVKKKKSIDNSLEWFWNKI